MCKILIFVISVFFQDVMSTRLYNQGVDKKGAGIYYNGVTDCALKILKHEGVAGNNEYSEIITCSIKFY